MSGPPGTTTPAGDRRAARLGPLLLGTLVGAMVAGRLETAAGCTALAVILAAIAGVRRVPASWLAATLGGTATAMLLNAYLTAGAPLPLPLPEVFGRRPSVEGLVLGTQFGLRLAGAMAAIVGLGALWPGERAADELARLFAPLERLRVPVREARAMIGLALRFVPLVGDEARRIRRIQSLRAGAEPRGLGARIARQRAVAIPALVAALERAERTALALEARHYRIRPVGGRSFPAGWSAGGIAVAAVSLLWRGT